MKSFDYRIAKNPAYWIVWLLAVLFLSAWAFATDVDTLYELYQVRDALSGTYVLTGNIDMEDTNPATKPAAWDIGTTYSIGDMVTHTHTTTERTYFSKVNGNVGNDPCDTDTTYWRVAWTTSEGWLPIGTDPSPFTGTVTGTGYTISNLYISRSSTGYQGLFGRILNAGTGATGLNVINASVTGGDRTAIVIASCATAIAYCTSSGTVSGTNRTGGLVGICTSTITSCSSSTTVGGTGDYVGGLVGYQAGNMTSCYATGAVTQTSATADYAGGLIGYLASGTVTKCYATGAVSVGDDNGGGFVGRVAGGTITLCYATGNTSDGDYYSGGFAGSNYSTISNCYSKGSVTGTNEVSGFACANTGTITNCYSTGAPTGATKSGFCHTNSGTVTLCYWDTTTSGIGTSTAGTGFATAYMVTPYESGDDPPINPSKPYYGWGWGGNAWQTDPDNRNGGYPILGWKTPRAIIGH